MGPGDLAHVLRHLKTTASPAALLVGLNVADDAAGFNGLVRFTGRLATGERVQARESWPTVTPQEARCP